MNAQRVIPAASSRFAAQLFNIITVVVMILSLGALLVGKMLSQKVGFLPFVLSLPPLMIWFGGSIFVYASIAHHPNTRAVHYNKWAGYRFYGVMGGLVVFGPLLYGLLGGLQGLMLVVGFAFVVIVPWSLLDILRARREAWSDVTVEAEQPAGGI